MNIKIKRSISTLLWELVECYVRAKWEDNGSPEKHLYNSFIGQWSNKIILLDLDEAKYLLEICKEVADIYTYDCMHPATKRGYRNLAKKLEILIYKY